MRGKANGKGTKVDCGGQRKLRQTRSALNTWLSRGRQNLFFFMSRRDRSMVNRKKHQEDKFHFERKTLHSQNCLKIPSPGIEPGSPALQTDSSPSEPPGKPNNNSARYVKCSELFLKKLDNHFMRDGVYVCMCVCGIRVKLQVCGWRTWPWRALPIQRITDISETKWWTRKRSCLLDSDSPVFPPSQAAFKQISSWINVFWASLVACCYC